MLGALCTGRKARVTSRVTTQLSPEPDGPPTMSYRFLILEDSITDRAQIKRAVRLSGLSAGVIQEASDVIEAIDLLTGHTADLVLASLDLPVASAAEMVGRLI